MNERRKLSGTAWTKIILVLVLCLMVLITFTVGTSGVLSISYPLQNRPVFTIGNHNWLVGSGTSSVDTLREIQLEWAYGDVTIVTTTGNAIEVIDHAASSAAFDQVHWAVENGTLYVLSNEPRISSSCTPTWGRHTCEIRIPQHLAQDLTTMNLSLASGSITLNGFKSTTLRVDIASGDFNTDKVEVRNANISVASGNLYASAFVVDTLKLELASGRINIAGTFKDITTSTASGNLAITSSLAPTRIKTEMASGTATFNFPAPADGFTAKVTKLSGNFNCGFATTQSGGNTYVNGNGSARYEFNVVSGSINLNPK